MHIGSIASLECLKPKAYTFFYVLLKCVSLTFLKQLKVGQFLDLGINLALYMHVWLKWLLCRSYLPLVNVHMCMT